MVENIQQKLDFNDITTWLFDLDNTLYPFEDNVFDQIRNRITEFICKELNIDEFEAKNTRERLYNLYGTSLRGLMIENNIEPDRFLDFVHDIDLSFLKPDPLLNEALKSLGSNKYIFTNASLKHAEQVLDKIGIEGNFLSIFSIENANYIPKPNIEPYKKLINQEKINPKESVMVEDTYWNLEPASKLGMKTLLIYPKNESLEVSKNKYINYKTTNLIEFLSNN